jgi:hypothetical protein
VGRTVDIDLTFQSPVRTSDLFHHLLDSGWVAVKDGHISYMVADFEWKKAKQQEFESVMGELDNDLAAGEVVGVSVFWRDSAFGGNLLIHENRESISFVPELNRRPLAGAPEFTDLGWYVERLVPALSRIGLVGIAIRDEP